MNQSLIIVIVGDSWAKNGDSNTYPMQLADKVGATVHNFAEIGVKSSALAKQVHEFTKNRKCSGSDEDVSMLAVIQCGGNNCLEDLDETMTKSMDEFSSQICEDIKSAVVALHKEGVKYFVISDVPFSANVPEIKVMIERYARDKKYALEKTKVNAIEREEKLNQAIRSMHQSLPQQFPGMEIVHFSIINELEKWKGQEELFDASGLHPTDEGHAKLQKSLLAEIEKAGFPFASSAQSSAATMTPEKAKSPSKRPLADVVSEESIEQQFQNIIHSEESLRDLRQDEQLDFYGLYKQALFGDNETVEPNCWNYKAHKKWEAWMAHKTKSKTQAMKEYIDMFRAKGAKRIRSS